MARPLYGFERSKRGRMLCLGWVPLQHARRSFNRPSSDRIDRGRKRTAFASISPSIRNCSLAEVATREHLEDRPDCQPQSRGVARRGG